MNKKNIYNTIPEGYVPVPKEDKSKQLSLLRQGSITEITLDGKTFQVHDPQRVENIIKMVERHEDRLYNTSQEVSKMKQKCHQLEAQVTKLVSKVNRLQEQLRNAGLDRFE